MQNPLAYVAAARELENEGDYRAAESQFRAAIAAADALPLMEYKFDFQAELTKYASDANYESKPGMKLDDVKQAYNYLLCMPFFVRLQLAGFYARHEAYPEARDTCNEAFEVGVDNIVGDDKHYADLKRRALELRNAINDVLGPENLVRAAETHFDQLDRDGDGFLHESELKQAMFDLNIDSAGQEVIRHLLYHYFEIEAAHNDEMGIDINGISRKDLRDFQKKKNSTWRRLKPKQ